MYPFLEGQLSYCLSSPQPQNLFFQCSHALFPSVGDFEGGGLRRIFTKIPSLPPHSGKKKVLLLVSTISSCHQHDGPLTKCTQSTQNWDLGAERQGRLFPNLQQRQALLFPLGSIPATGNLPPPPQPPFRKLWPFFPGKTLTICL